LLCFESLILSGARIAAMSDLDDGDCRLSSEEGMEARQRFCQACGADFTHLTVGKQIHGTRITVATETDRGRGHQPFHAAFPDTDGLITQIAGLPLGISIADCVPVFLLDPVRRAAGLVHAGRVGTLGGIAAQSVAAMHEAFGTSPKDVHAVIGPSAGPEAYEVSDELAVEFAAAGYPTQGRRLDLWGANALQLTRAGVPRDQVEITGICTISSNRFHSHRAHGNGSRNLAVLML